MNCPSFDPLVKQLHDMADARKELAESYAEDEGSEMGQRMRIESDCYRDAATIVWAYGRQFTCGGGDVSAIQNPS